MNPDPDLAWNPDPDLAWNPDPDLALHPDPDHQNAPAVLNYVNVVPKENGGILQSNA